ncbi:alkaline phosphatase family protein [Rhizobium miluonense]|uniref:Predicted pyrophosphatase or phosphodiesterase, AlkP superfamily n=1 Tax=Rhizobium miluonense TaxID=411945 RepID=A0A1C3WZX7_9HYPH|nr:alkaline phosphatase family protein [Rhizobium miluonense]SCB45587.1 Predicted pyrophosphatase or phosphodiesterase, AlkP superfamily [Rhizobium miluonense]
MTTAPKFLIVSFDGLRPDLIDSAQTPNIARTKGLGATLSAQRTVYPSETRVAFPSLVTGATSSKHGMVGNKYVDRSATLHRYVDTADAVLLDQLNRESGGNLMGAPTLGEILGRAGKSLAVLATNTPGTTRFFHHKAEEFGHIRVSGHFPEACTPQSALSEIVGRFGALPPVPPQGEPDIEAQTLITSIFLDYIWPKHAPDVTVLSYGEPDTASHFNGTGGAKTREAIAHSDAEFGRVLDWWEAEGRAAGVQIIVLSDHGHITAHTRVSVAGSLKAAGFNPATAPSAGVDVVVVPGQVGALYLADRSTPQLARLVEALIEQPWIGPIFTAGKNEVEGLAPGSFASHLVFADHERAPDVYFAFRADDGVDEFGLVGGTFYDNDRRPGLGVHGGLHPKELASVGIVAGSAFRSSAHVSSVPTGICDIGPTILSLLDIPVPGTMTGRVLSEVLSEEYEGGLVRQLPKVAAPQIFEVGLNSYSQKLQRTAVGRTVYLDGGWIETKSTIASPLKRRVEA